MYIYGRIFEIDMPKDIENNPHSRLISPYGGELVDLLAEPDSRKELIGLAASLPAIQLSSRSQFDLELLATGAFSPLRRFMGSEDYRSVLETMRLTDGTLFPIPICLPVNDDVSVRPGSEVALRGMKFELLAYMKVDEVYEWNLDHEARAVAGTTDSSHPLVAEMHSWGKRYISGEITVIGLPKHHDFEGYRLTPEETRKRLDKCKHGEVIAFQTRNPMHRAHEELTKRAAEEIKGTLLLHPVVGNTKPGDVDRYSRVRCYKTLFENYYDHSECVLSLIPLAMRMAGTKEALWHAIIRRNYGANHLIVGRDHASPGNDHNGQPFYGPYDAQELVREHQEETGVRPYVSKELVYLPDEDRYEEADQVKENAKTMFLSGSQMRGDFLNKGLLLPGWCTRREVAEILHEVYPPKQKQGFCVWFTGLSGAGKSTIADVLIDLLAERGRSTTTLDGDVVRTHLSKGLGFSKEDRDTNIRRIGFVASQIVKHNGTVVCAAISPYQSTRDEVSKMIGDEKFILVYIDTPIEICEQRDAKGLYGRARRGEIKGFTGVDDPYEEPLRPSLVLNTVDNSPKENARIIVDHIKELGFLNDR